MMTYQQQSDDYKETSTEMRFAMAIFAVAAGLELAAGLYGMNGIAAFDWIIVFRSAAVGLVAGGAAYALALIIATIAPGLPALLLKEVEEATGLDLDGGADLPTGQPVRERVTVEPLPLVEQPAFEDTAVSIHAAPEWELRVEEMIYDDRVLINGRLEELPKGFDTAWLYTVARERAAGKLGTVSTIKLDEVGISRWGNGGSPASLMIQILENTGCVQSRGERQPYDWTDAGKHCFPSPTD